MSDRRVVCTGKTLADGQPATCGSTTVHSTHVLHEGPSK